MLAHASLRWDQPEATQIKQTQLDLHRFEFLEKLTSLPCSVH